MRQPNARRVVSVYGIILQFDAYVGLSATQQVMDVLDRINFVLKKETGNFNVRIIVHPEDLDIIGNEIQD